MSGTVQLLRNLRERFWWHRVRYTVCRRGKPEGPVRNMQCGSGIGKAAFLCTGMLIGLISIFGTVRPAAAQLSANPACYTPAQECLCDNSFEDCRTPLLQLIQNEPASGGIDVSFWFMTDHRYSGALIDAFNRGVPVRVILDTQADANYPASKTRRTELANAGIPIRECIASSGINHWKAMIFHGQNKVQFSAANYADGSFTPSPTTSPYIRYVDEAIYFTHDPVIVNSFKEKFDDHWVDTTAFKSLANAPAPLTRRAPDGTYAISGDMNFVPDQNFENRLRTEVLKETQQIDAVMFRITSAKIPDALIARAKAGVPVRLITDERQYRNTAYLWHSYNVDRMYQAQLEGANIQIKFKNKALTDQDMHQKSIVLHNRGGAGQMVVFGSSNWTSASSSGQREHNYFSRKGWMVGWFIEQFERKWNNLKIDGSPIGAEVFTPFTPGFPETPVNISPANDALGQGISVTLRWEGGWWAHKYDIYLSRDPTPTTSPVFAQLDYAPGSATAGVKSTKESFTIPGSLQPGTTYYWQIRGKTMANMGKLGPVWRFTTSGGLPPPPAPSGLVASPVSAGRIDLTWSNVSGEEGYKVERKLASSSTWAQIGITAADVNTYHDSNSGLASGTTYNYRVRAFTTGGNSGYSNIATATTNSVSLSPSDVVLYAAKAPTRVGNWSVVSDSTAAGGQRINNPNMGAATVTTALANPAHYFEMQFTAVANQPYHIWMRGKATSNNGYNDSVWVQFTNTVTGPGGTPVNRIGTTSAQWVNLQDCAGCTLNGWGWQDNHYGGLGQPIYFATSGAQTIRVQVREDGVSFDQIVLSPDTYLNTSPGATKLDNVILPEQSGSSSSAAVSASDVVLYTANATRRTGNWSFVTDATAAAGRRIANPNFGAATITSALPDPLHYFELQFTATANQPYRIWMRGKATSNSGYNDSVWVQFTNTVSAPGGSPVNRIGSSSAAWVNLQDCQGCTLNGWGWQDNGYGGFGPVIYFATSGNQTIRVQVREDGPSFDQIVLSPDTYLNRSPGATKADTVILPAQPSV